MGIQTQVLCLCRVLYPVSHLPILNLVFKSAHALNLTLGVRGRRFEAKDTEKPCLKTPKQTNKQIKILGQAQWLLITVKPARAILLSSRSVWATNKQKQTHKKPIKSGLLNENPCYRKRVKTMPLVLSVRHRETHIHAHIQFNRR